MRFSESNNLQGMSLRFKTKEKLFNSQSNIKNWNFIKIHLYFLRSLYQSKVSSVKSVTIRLRNMLKMCQFHH